VTVIALAIAVMIGDGCCAFVSLSLGKQESDKARKSVGNSIVLMIIVRADRMEEKKQEREADKPERKPEEKVKEDPHKAERDEGRVSFKENLSEKKSIVKANDQAKKDAPKLEASKKKVEEIA